MRIRDKMLILFVLLALTISCRPSHLSRPYGELKLGPASTFASQETVLEKARLVVRYDKGGYSVMSTLCSYDLSPLKRIRADSGEYIWASEYTSSAYRDDGRVLRGPTTTPLPYYKLIRDASVTGGPKDTLYAVIGVEVSPEWRLSTLP